MMSGYSKKEAVRRMFDDISPKYDFLNHFLSLGIDRSWRNSLVRMLHTRKPQAILDVATGTGDLAIALSRLKPLRIVGIDISGNMLAIGRKKLAAKGLDKLITLQCADSEETPFHDNSFDAVTVAFGVRNFEDLELGLSEMRRVLRPGGIMLVLEFSHPHTFPARQLYSLYSRYVIPRFGRQISGNENAYSYLPESVAAFPSGSGFLEIMKSVGLKNTGQRSMTFGIASIYRAEK